MRWGERCLRHSCTACNYDFTNLALSAVLGSPMFDRGHTGPTSRSERHEPQRSERIERRNFVQSVLWRGFALRDGNLITGQQSSPGTDIARVGR